MSVSGIESGSEEVFIEFDGKELCELEMVLFSFIIGKRLYGELKYLALLEMSLLSDLLLLILGKCGVCDFEPCRSIIIIHSGI